MNKIKFLYDVVSVLREKEVIAGKLKVEAKKDLNIVFNLNNEFEKNMVSGQTKIKLNSEVDCDGKKVKHESCTEFNVNDCRGHMHHGFLKHVHDQHRQHPHFHHCGHGFGFKSKLSKIACALSILKNLNVEEKDDKSAVVSLSLSEIPEKMRAAIQEKMKEHNTVHAHHHHPGFMKELHNVDLSKIEFNMYVNGQSEVEKIALEVTGQPKDQTGSQMNLAAELMFSW